MSDFGKSGMGQPRDAKEKLAIVLIREGGRGWQKNVRKGWSLNGAEAEATRRVKAAAENDPPAPSTGRMYINTRAQVAAPIEPSDQTELVARVVLAVRCGAGFGRRFIWIIWDPYPPYPLVLGRGFPPKTGTGRRQKRRLPRRVVDKRYSGGNLAKSRPKAASANQVADFNPDTQANFAYAVFGKIDKNLLFFLVTTLNY